MDGEGYLSCALKAAAEANVLIHATDRTLVKQQVYLRASAMGKLLKVVAAVANEPDTSENPDVPIDPTEEGNGVTIGNGAIEAQQLACSRGLGRLGNCGKKKMTPGDITNKTHQFKGANDHKEYQSAVKGVVTEVLQRYAHEMISLRQGAIQMKILYKINTTLLCPYPSAASR